MSGCCSGSGGGGSGGGINGCRGWELRGSGSGNGGNGMRRSGEWSSSGGGEWSSSGGGDNGDSDLRREDGSSDKWRGGGSGSAGSGWHEMCVVVSVVSSIIGHRTIIDNRGRDRGGLHALRGESEGIVIARLCSASLGKESVEGEGTRHGGGWAMQTRKKADE